MHLCFLELQLTEPPVIIKENPFVYLLLVRKPTQYESEYPEVNNGSFPLNKIPKLLVTDM